MSIRVMLVCDHCGKEHELKIDRRGGVPTPEGWLSDMPPALQRVFGMARDACSQACMLELDRAAITQSDALTPKRGFTT